MTFETFEDHGLHFEYPSSWELEVTDHGQVMTVAVQDPGGLGFALITTDESRPDPADVADAALEAMREEYPDLDAAPAMETINEQVATGHDVEFFAMDMTNAASIRCFRTSPYRPGVWPVVRYGRGRPSRPDPRSIPDNRGYRAVADLSHGDFPATSILSISRRRRRRSAAKVRDHVGFKDESRERGERGNH